MNEFQERQVNFNWPEPKKAYDVIIIDPPTNQRGSFVAEKDYPQVLKRIPGGSVCAA